MFNQLRIIQEKRRREKEEIKKHWSDSGDCDKVINLLKEKEKNRPDIKDLPW